LSEGGPTGGFDRRTLIIIVFEEEIASSLGLVVKIFLEKELFSYRGG